MEMLMTKLFCVEISLDILNYDNNGNTLNFFNSLTSQSLIQIITKRCGKTYQTAELWLAPLQVAHATSDATFSVAQGLAPLLFKLIASLVFWSVSCDALIASFISEQNRFLKHNCKTRAGETLIIVWDCAKHEQPLMHLLGIFPSYSLSFVKICIYVVACMVKQLVQV